MSKQIKDSRQPQKFWQILLALSRSERRLRAAIGNSIKQKKWKKDPLAQTLDHVIIARLCLRQVEPDLIPEAVPTFVVSSLFLHECFNALTADDKEQFFFVTGPEVNGTFVLDQRYTLEHISRTEAGVVADPKSTHRVLAKLEAAGHLLLGHFHSHPGYGLESTGPSGTDLKFQAALERAGYPTVAAIFSRDGYIRFFRADNREFEIDIHGKGVEHVESTIYRLTSLD
jgi:proteasome lid subunit RPN8/RPN11